MNGHEQVSRSDPKTHIVNTTRVMIHTDVRVPFTELMALLKQRGLIVPPDANLTARIIPEENVLVVGWVTEDEQRQTANIAHFPLVAHPDPTLTEPTPPDDAQPHEPLPIPDLLNKVTDVLNSQNADPIGDIQRVRRENLESTGGIPPAELPRKRVPGAVVFYSIPEIEADQKHAKYHGIVRPGYYAFDGPTGNEAVSGPFPSEQIAYEQFVPWTEDVQRDLSNPIEPDDEPAKAPPKEVDTIRVETNGRTATINVPANVNLQQLTADIRSAVERQLSGPGNGGCPG